jgi:hypothetical protein
MGDPNNPRTAEGLQQGLDRADNLSQRTVGQICEECGDNWVEVGAIDESTGEPMPNLPYKIFDVATKQEVASGTLDANGEGIRHEIPTSNTQLFVMYGTDEAISEAMAKMGAIQTQNALQNNAVSEWRGFEAGLTKEEFSQQHRTRTENGDFADADRGLLGGAASGIQSLSNLATSALTLSNPLENDYRRRRDDAWDQYQLATGDRVAGSGESFGAGAAQGVTFGFDDEIGAMLGSLFDDRSYEELVDAHRHSAQQRQISNPGWFLGGEITGALPTIFIPVGGAAAAGARGAATTGRAVTLGAKSGAQAGAAFGALSGAGHDTGSILDRLDGAALGAATGGLAGAVLGGAGVLVARGASRLRIWAVARLNRGTGPLRNPAREVGPGEGDLIGPEHGLQSRQWWPFENPVRGVHGEKATKYLWTIDERGINIARETTPWPTERLTIVHTNLSSRASIGGEAWFGPGKTVTINAGSGRFGDGAGITPAQWTATVRYWTELGYDVIAIPFGSR